MSVEIGHGCPFGKIRCTKHCISEGYNEYPPPPREWRVLIITCIMSGGMVSVEIGHGCPFGKVRCTKYCISEGYNAGFCWKVACCCIPKTTDFDELTK